MQTRTKSVLLQVVMAGLMLAFCACGGQEEESPSKAQAAVSVAVTPPAVELFPGDPHPFTAAISRTDDTTLTLAVDGL